MMVHSKESALFKYFCTAVSEALYVILDGERERVTAHLKALGRNDAQIKRMPRRFWRRYCR